MAQTKSPYFKTSDLRIPPQSLEAEKALLGSIMMRPEVVHEIIDIVSDRSFYSDRHRLIWINMLELHSKATPIDILSLSSKLKEKDLLETTGGMTYLSELVGGVPSSANAKYYAEIVQKKQIMRDLISASEFVGNLGFDEAGDLDELLDKAEKRIFDVTNYGGNQHKFVALKDTLTEAWDRLEKLHKTKGELRGIPTGYKELDNKLAGFQKSDLIILAARPSMGKTSLALDIARKAAVEHNIAVGIFSLEMSSQQLVDRMLAAESSVDAWKLRTGHNLSIDHDFKAIRDAMDRLSKAPIYIDDQAANNILKMRAVARRLKSEKGLGLIIVDYLQLMVPTNGREQRQSRPAGHGDLPLAQTAGSRARGARACPVPALPRRRKPRRGGRPQLSDLRDSGSIEQDADVVMFIHREDKYNKDSARPNIAEHHHRKAPQRPDRHGRALLRRKEDDVPFNRQDRFRRFCEARRDILSYSILWFLLQWIHGPRLKTDRALRRIPGHRPAAGAAVRLFHTDASEWFSRRVHKKYPFGKEILARMLVVPALLHFLNCFKNLLDLFR